MTLHTLEDTYLRGVGQTVDAISREEIVRAIDLLVGARATTPNDNVSTTMMARGNDQDYGDVLTEQLDSHLQAGDTVVLISTSWNSPNVVRWAAFARDGGVTVIGFTGPPGVDLAELTVCVRVPSTHIGQQDVHLVVNHTIGAAIRAHRPSAQQCPP